MLVWSILELLAEISCFLAAESSISWCDVRTTVERWMLKDAGDGVYTMVYETLRGFVCKLGGSLAEEMNVS
jgi:hypothetical protein